jgi:hypothetical protein
MREWWCYTPRFGQRLQIKKIHTICASGEMVYTLASGASARKGVEVQVLSRAPKQ